mmetsp:Transcript_67083/g.160792  ORF Transcript_67083/g.160792 Transcript_67083/m.160792 type:complete len:141 (+) Transcript_67083:37-459(+)
MQAPPPVPGPLPHCYTGARSCKEKTVELGLKTAALQDVNTLRMRRRQGPFTRGVCERHFKFRSAIIIDNHDDEPSQLWVSSDGPASAARDFYTFTFASSSCTRVSHSHLRSRLAHAKLAGLSTLRAPSQLALYSKARLRR